MLPLARIFPVLYLLDIPNALTTLNAGMAVVAIGFACHGHMRACAVAVFLASMLDYVDGFVARTWYLEAVERREFGKQLDTLADLLNFSVTPAVVMLVSFHDGIIVIAACTLLILSSALRLANFNVAAASQSTGYLGIPTTYSGFLFANWLLLHAAGLVSDRVIAVGSISLAILQIVNIRVRKFHACVMVPVMAVIFTGTAFFTSYI
jgi:CDP-diacylglycerol--serine O-phosphatidyltransferase